MSDLLQDTVLELEFQGVKKQFTMLQVSLSAILIVFTVFMQMIGIEQE